VNAKPGLFFVLALSLILFVPTVRAEQVYTVDPAKSLVRFKVSQAGLPLVSGRFNTFAGTLAFDGQRLTSFEGAVEINSLSTGIRARDKDLKAEHFFGAQRFPRMTIRSSNATQAGGRVRILADVTIRDITKPVELRGTAVCDGKIAAASLQGVLKRKDFGLRLNRFFEFFVNENVYITLKLNAVEKERL
jgi:polyisoprenoid-binding protein YceI